MSEKVEKKKNALHEEFGFFDDPRDTFEYIIAKTKEIPHLAPEFKKDEFLVKGCVSSLWLAPSYDKEKNVCNFSSDADSVITRGIAALVCGAYSGLSPSEVLELDPAIFDELKIGTQLSPNRRNGLSQLCRKIAEFATCALAENPQK